jgi:predicted amidohydrolase YtcJ
MSRVPAEPLRLDYLIRAGTIHAMTGETFRSVGVRGAEIVAVSADADGLDGLAASGTVAGFGVTVQYPVLGNMGSEMLDTWGPERTRQVTPLDQWLATGADRAAGTDIVRPSNPVTNIWGMVTRGTKSAGIQGPEHGIDAVTALRPYTMGTAALNHEQDRLGSITPGKLADLVGYPVDPTFADAADLADLTPAFTMAGGRVTHDPDQRLAK